jgi:hypothetical protein
MTWGGNGCSIVIASQSSSAETLRALSAIAASMSLPGKCAGRRQIHT